MNIREFMSHREGQGYPTSSDLWAIIGIYVVANIATSGAVMLLVKVVPGIESMSTFLMYTLGLGLTLLYALYQRYSRRLPNTKLLYFSLKGFSIPLIIYGVALLLAIAIVIEPLLTLFPQSMMEMLNSLVGRGVWPVITAVVAAPILEELLFRGVILQGIRERSGAMRAVLISSAIFGAIHVIPPQAINAFFAALILGFIYVRSGSLLTVMVIHAINNAVAYVISGGDDPYVTTRSLIGNDTTYYIIYGFTLAVSLYLIYRIYAELRKIDDAI